MKVEVEVNGLDVEYWKQGKEVGSERDWSEVFEQFSGQSIDVSHRQQLLQYIVRLTGQFYFQLLGAGRLSYVHGGIPSSEGALVLALLLGRIYTNYIAPQYDLKICIPHYQSLSGMTQDIDTHQKLDHEVMPADTLQLEDDLVGIKIAVSGFLEKGSGLTKYTVYLIRGEDREGTIEVYRRFSEFFALRELLLQRWPGCFIPAVPDKKVIGKNDDMIKKNRQRFLDNFVKKIASFPYLYYSQEFQVLLRSKEANVTETFQKYPKPSYQEIINRYKDSFSQLAGKQINNQTAVKISSFYTFLQASQQVLSGYKDMAKRLAMSRSTLDYKLSSMFTRIIPEYEKCCLTEYVNYDESKMVYINPKNVKLQEHGPVIANLCRKNPYWLIYDLVKLEDRDGEAFLVAIESRAQLQNKKHDVQSKIRSNQKEIEEASMGNTTVKSLFIKGSKEEVKVKLERENQQLEKERTNLMNVIDIISALLAYITIDQYKTAKKKYYGKIFRAVAGYEINFIETMYDVWNNCLTQTCKLTGGKNDLQDKFYPTLSTITAAKIEEKPSEVKPSEYPEVEVQVQETSPEQNKQETEKPRKDSNHDDDS